VLEWASRIDYGDSASDRGADTNPQEHRGVRSWRALGKLDRLAIGGALLSQPGLRVGHPGERVEEEKGLDGRCEQVSHGISVCEVSDFVREDELDVVRIEKSRREENGGPEAADEHGSFDFRRFEQEWRRLQSGSFGERV
jgi:hypothetical protein